MKVKEKRQNNGNAEDDVAAGNQRRFRMHARVPSKEEKGGNTEEEDRDVMDSHEPQEVTAVREEINLLLAEEHRTVALKGRRGRYPQGGQSGLCLPHNSPSLDVSQHLDPNKDDLRKGVPGNMKDIPRGVKFDISSITLESDKYSKSFL
ncbi:hypothetical protein DUI87_05320 [Hirundo rustica rustica]|uniref:Uncharacterized protein n=1 Tax=Hirundo rustica rustica TaxID=333673 RepID=A0A3M0KXV9_HIRRU|nr:hypothetical protein DUI87_05320 [Hirundo rustica rustica]